MSLYRKYRPQTFTEVIGQKQIVQTLGNALLLGRVGHAYLFTGPRGTGKTTLARIFAKALQCTGREQNNPSPCLQCENCQRIGNNQSLDIFEIDAASNTGVDNIRELRETVKLPPTSGRYKIYIIDEVHMLSIGAFNALLKTLEEPPAHVIFILATTEIHKIPETILSRCQRFDFTRLNLEEIVEKLHLIAKAEKIRIEKDALEMLAIAAEGGMRDAESLLTQVMALQNDTITAKEVADLLGMAKRQFLEEFGQLLLAKNAKGAIELVSKLAHLGHDLEIFNKSWLNFLRQLLLLSVDPKMIDAFKFELTTEQAKTIAELAKQTQPEKVLLILENFGKLQGKIRSAFIPQLPLEMAIVESCYEIVRPDANGQFVTLNQPPPPVVSATEHQEKSATANNTPKNTEVAASSQAPVTNDSPQEKPAQANSEDHQEHAPTNFTLSDAHKVWKAATREIGEKNHSLTALLASCQPAKVEGVTLAIACKYSFYRDKLNEAPNQLTCNEVFAKLIGSRVKIKAYLNEELGIASAPETSPGMPNFPQEPRETSSLLSDAMGIMGGQIVE